MPDPSDGTKGKINLLDRAILYASPERGLKRLAHRELFKRKYAAAKTTRSTGAWAPVDLNSKDIISTSLPAVRARVRQLVRDFPFFSRGLNIIVDFTVADGFNFQSKIKLGNGDYNKALNKKIESALSRWMEKDNCDVSKTLHFHEMTRLSERSEVETGESFFLKRKVKGRFLPVALQAIEPDRLSPIPADGLIPSNGFDDGIEFSQITGEAVAYHFYENSYRLKPVRVPAEYVIHTFDLLRPGQHRGISAFTCAVLCADDLSNYIDSTLDIAKLASRYLAFIKTPDIGGVQVPRVTDTDDDGNMIEDMENAIIEYLTPGQEIELADHKIPNDTFDPFTRFILRMTAIGMGVSYELLTGDYSGLSYSNLRAIRSDLASVLQPRVFRRVNHFCHPAYRWFLESLALSNLVYMPSFFTRQWEYEQASWKWKGLASPDPLKDNKADILLIDKLLMSPQGFFGKRGEDAETVLDEWAEWRKMLKEKDLEDQPEEVSTSSSNNPAKLMEVKK